MIRVALEGLLLFLAPFAAFALLLLLMRRNVLKPESWSSAAAWLTMCGLALVVGAFLVTGLFGERHTGAFEPSHVENGKVVPGRFR